MICYSHRLYVYQRERFPLAVLVLGFLPPILSSTALLSSEPRFLPITLALLLSLAYLFRIRVADDHRDFDHDNEHHPDRPIQRGAAALSDLEWPRRLALVLMLACAAFLSPLALALTVAALLYSALAARDFFQGAQFRHRFFLHNAAHLFQMVLLQAIIYASFYEGGTLGSAFTLHALALFIGTVIYEVLRKIRTKDEEGTGNDSYSARLGFRSSVILVSVLLAADALLFVALSGASGGASAFILGSLVLALAAAAHHGRRKGKSTGKAMQAAFALAYACGNIALYLALT